MEALADLRIGADEGLCGKRQGSGKRQMLVRLTDLLHRQKGHRQIGRKQGQDASDIGLGDIGIDAERKMGAMLLDGRHRQHRNPTLSVTGRYIGPRHFRPVAFRHHILVTRLSGSARVLSSAFGENEPMQNPGFPTTMFSRPAFRIPAGFLAAAGFIVACAVAGNIMTGNTTFGQTLDKVSFGTNWLAEAEHGGHYQALVDGTYRRYGLDVTIIPGGPQVNNRILLPVGKLDFFMSANTLQSLDAVAQNIPTLAVAAMFQKEPQILMAHPDQGIDKFEDLKKLTLFISAEGLASYFQWLKADYGFSEDKVKPYTSNPQPFLADKRSAMQGYVTSEPYAIEKVAHFTPKVFLLADQGFNSYSTLIETRRDLVERKGDLVQRFVDASIIGWYNYLYRDNKEANALIKRQNPEMTDGLIAYSIAKMKEYGI